MFLTMILNNFRSSVEGFFASKGAAYAIPDGDFARKASLRGGKYSNCVNSCFNLVVLLGFLPGRKDEKP
jgi:hypothetical protein